jgi:4-hydroxybenzoate polyprenyltransferase
MATSRQAVARGAPSSRETAGAALRGLIHAARPMQWTKNAFVFAGLIFSVNLDSPHAWALSSATFAVFCAASSAAYLLNDVLDVEEDRVHPVKRRRPIAAGTVSRRLALGASAVLAVAAGVGAALVGFEVLLLLLVFLVLQAAYSVRIKHIILLDVLAISALFVVRAAAGAVAIDVRLSPWLAVCTGLIALFLALGKRRAELVDGLGEAKLSRAVLSGYSVELLDQLIVLVAAATVSAYSLYTFTATSSEAMMLTIPYVVYGLFRYLFLLRTPGIGEEPETTTLTDKPLVSTVVLWITTAAVILLATD